MSHLKSAREKKNQNLSQASTKLAFSRQHLSRLEQGRTLATREQAQAIREHFGVPVLETSHLSKFAELQREIGLRPFEVELVNPDTWRVAYSFWGERLREAGLSLDTFDWMSHFLPCDSAHECYMLLQAALAGAEPFLGNPHQWGFDLHPIIDRSGRLLAERVLPGLIYRDDEVDIILWPQVSMRIDPKHAFRLDCLMLYRRGNRVSWIAVELDGSGHDSGNDVYRSEKLGMLEVRLTGPEIRQGQAFALLQERAEEQLRWQREPAAEKPPIRLVQAGRGLTWRPQAPPGPRSSRPGGA